MRIPTSESTRGVAARIRALRGRFQPPSGPDADGTTSARRRAGRAGRRTAPLAVLVVVLVLVLGPAAALALMVNNGSPFGSVGSAAGQFASGGPAGVSVNQSNGDVYVADPGNARVDEFSSSGAFIRAWGWGVADGANSFEICTSTCQAGASNTANESSGGLTSPTSIAVDSSGGASNGDVYVGDAGDAVVQKYDSTGHYLATINGTGSTEGTFSGVVGVAVDQSGDLWVADNGTNNILAFDDTGTFIRQWNDTYGTTSDIAVDSTTNAVYLIRGSGQTERWTLTGGGETVVDNNSTNALAIDPVTGDIYTSDLSNGNQVFVYDSSNNRIDTFAQKGISSTAGLAYYAPTSSTLSEGGNLYISDSTSNNVDTFIPPQPGPPVIDAESSSNIGALGATVSAQVNPFGVDTTCVFEYVDDANYMTNQYTNASSAPCTPSDLGSSFTDQTATAVLTGLTPSTLYHYQVVATNGKGTTDGSTDVGDQTFMTTPPPSIDSESVANVTSTDATLEAQINPNGGDTTYQFQFGTDTNYTGGTVPAKPVDIGSGTSDQAASVPLTGLQPNTTYHFRVMTDGGACGSACEGNDQSFTTYASNLLTGLPDNRGYEMVTPPSKDNGEPYDRGGDLFGVQASSGGNSLAYFSFNAFPGSVFDGSYYLGSRGTSSWTSQNLIPPQSTESGLLCASLGPVMEAYSSDLSKGILADGGSLLGTCGADNPPLVSGEPQGVSNLFVRTNGGSGSYQLVDADNAGQPTPTTAPTPANTNFDAASGDLSHVVFDENAQLTQGALSGDNLYEWAGGVVTLVTYLPNGTPVQGSVAGGTAGNEFHAVSDDGSKVFFTAGGNLYVRENGSSTVQVDASQAGGTGGGGTFLAATPDGSNVYFMDGDTAGLTSSTVSGSGENLYDYNLANNTLTDLTPVSQADVDGISGMSSDGSYLYFVANGVLPGATNSNSAGQTATAGQPNLYVLHNGAMKFIALLSGGDSCDWAPTCARVSSSGGFIAFTSNNTQTPALTPYNNNGNSEIFVSDAGAGHVGCASCNPSGVPASTGATIKNPYNSSLLGAGAQYFQRYVSDNGQVFFDTPDSLLPRASNGVRNVYEWEPNGSGNCTSSTSNGGCLNLISTGTSEDDSFYVDSSASGSDVFFMSSQQLVAQDTDGAVDIYDARAGGGFPPSAPAPACIGDGCKPATTAPPSAPVVGSVTFFGPGNATPGAPRAIAVVSSPKVLKGFKFSVVVLVPGKGVITISGVGLKTVKKAVKRAGSYRLTVGLSLAKRHTLNARHKRKLTITVHVRYKPAGGSASSETLTVTVKA